MPAQLTRGQRAAEWLVQNIGWKFIIYQTVVIILWMAANVAWIFHRYEWDPYPFILLNLGLSLQAAYTGPIVMIAQRRQDSNNQTVRDEIRRNSEQSRDMIAVLHEDHNTQMDELRAICEATHAEVRKQ